MAKLLTKDDIVVYSRAFLKSVFGNFHNAMHDAKGTVLEVKNKPPRAKVKWDNNEGVTTVLFSNLSKIGKGTEKCRFDGVILESQQPNAHRISTTKIP